MFKIKFLTGLLLAFSISLASNAQNEWELIFDDAENFVRQLSFVPGADGQWQTGWGITAYPESNIIKTTDGGETWTVVGNSYSNLLTGISFANENTGYICTLNGGEENSRGHILKSTDGGLTWIEIFGTDDESFDKIEFKDELNGLVTGVNNYYTEDGGETWVASNAPSGFYWGIDYAAGDTYFGVQLGGAVGKTTDNGMNWSNVYNAPTALFGVAFYDENHGIIGGDGGTVTVTHDGGDTWNQQTLGTGGGNGDAVGAFDADIMYTGLGSEIWITGDGGENWNMDIDIAGNAFQDVFVTDQNVVYICGEDMDGNGRIWRKHFDVPLVANFEASETNLCYGSSVDFTDLSYYNVVSWDWTFEGGTPSSSTDQNPTVTYNSGGLLDVTLTVTNADGGTETLTKEDLINVSEIPMQPETPSGDEDICTSNGYAYTVAAVEYAQSYDWELSPASAGELTWNDNEAFLTTSDNWTGDFTIKVNANNFCGDSPWSADFEGTISLSPDVFALQGGGSYCEGGEGVEITLDGSQEGVEYALYLDGSPTGDPVAGTGSAISFGMHTTGGIYESLGYNGSCEAYMLGQIEVVVLLNPTPQISGLDMVCDEDVTDYETTENSGSTYTWEVTGGTIIEGQGTAMITIEWGEAGNGSVILTEENEVGCETTTDAFDVFIDDCTDIIETGFSNFNVYPNPATNKLNVDFTNESSNDTRIIIYNHLGQVMLESDQMIRDGNHSVQFDVSKLRNGLYIIKVQSGSGSRITKQIIKN